jgi:hypothetical protein
MEQSPQQLRGSPRKHTIRPDKLPTEQEKMAEPITREQAHDNAPLGAERFSGQDIHRSPAESGGAIPSPRRQCQSYKEGTVTRSGR